MSFVRKHVKLIAVAASCTAIGAAASLIASAGAASTSTTTSAQSPKAAHPRLAVRRAIRATVHGDLVVPTKSGFASVTFDRGFAESVSGQQLTLKEGTKTATYKTITLTIPSDALVRENHQVANLSDIKSGQHVLVFKGPNRTVVLARDVK
jgi:hypothetical protein